jgi:large subunit ribosomal protein L18
MNRIASKLQNLRMRKARVRARVHGTAQRPRLSVAITNRHISAQLIDDDAHITLAAVTTVGKKASSGTMTERAAEVGEQIAKVAKGKKISAVVFDRGGRLYHGRTKALADAARKGGLEF